MTLVQLVIPSIHREGMAAATTGFSMSSRATPQGFTFCPYDHGTVERWNFLSGCVQLYTTGELPTAGEA